VREDKVSALVDNHDRPADLSPGAPAPDIAAPDTAADDVLSDSDLSGGAPPRVAASSDASSYDSGSYDPASDDAAATTVDEATYVDAAGDDERDGPTSATSEDAAQEGAAPESSPHQDLAHSVNGASKGSTDSAAPVSSGAQVVQDARVPTRAQLRVDFGAHLEANYRRLVAQLYAITLDPAEAHSAVQDAYSRAWRSWATVSRTPDPTGWVRRVAVRSTIRGWRRFRLRSRRTVGISGDTSVDAVLDALRRLPAPERRCVVLHHMAGSPLPEIAAVERVSLGTTAARLARAQQVVSASLADVLSDGLWQDEPIPLDGWAAPEWNDHQRAASGRADDEEDQP
jgi:DNA-directed RNA polymerase specialized sigma24 family protein